MKILWFANTPCGATERLTGEKVTGGGWLSSLSEQIVQIPNIELHIAFYWGKPHNSFEHNGINYHPLLRSGDNSKLGRLVNRYKQVFCDTTLSRELPEMVKVIEFVRPDIIHIHGSEENFGMIAKETLSCPVVLSIQGLLSPYLCKFYSGFSKSSIEKGEGIIRKILCNGIGLSERSMRKRATMEREFIYLIPNIIGRTFWDKACSLTMNPSRRYFEVGEILRNEFYGVRWNKKAFGKPLVLTSTISSGVYKGIETIFQTSSVLKKAGVDFVWNIIGLDKTDFLVGIAQKLTDCSAEELGINLLGRKNAFQMTELMKNADMFIQVSHIENSPNSLCEAMLLGMPIIATNVGGTSSMLENNVEGRLVQDGDPYVMAGVIMEMSNDFETAKEYGVKAAETAALRHDKNHVCFQLIEVYETLLK